MASKTGDGLNSGSGTDAVEGEGHHGIMDKVKAAMGGAPWQVGTPEQILTSNLDMYTCLWRGLITAVTNATSCTASTPVSNLLCKSGNCWSHCAKIVVPGGA